MNPAKLFCCLLLLLLAGGSLLALDAPPIGLRSLLAEMTDRDATAKWPVPAYALKQARSYDRKTTDPADEATWFANFDSGQFIWIEDNHQRREWVIMDHSGPGAVTRMWLPLEPSKDQHATKYTDYGLLRFTVNGKAADVNFDGFASQPIPSGPINLGAYQPKDGKFILRSEVVGTHPASAGERHFFAIDCVVPQPPP